MFDNQDNTQQPTNQVPDDVMSASLNDPVTSSPALPDPINSPFGQPVSPAAADSSPLGSDDSPAAPSTPKPDTDDLLTMKQSALQQLSPLVGQLDQSPEEKFRTTMMMIQAADDQTLLKSAYETAQQITDEKAKAQALLDVVNEINYFTQNHNQQ